MKKLVTKFFAKDIVLRSGYGGLRDTIRMPYDCKKILGIYINPKIDYEKFIRTDIDTYPHIYCKRQDMYLQFMNYVKNRGLYYEQEYINGELYHFASSSLVGGTNHEYSIPIQLDVNVSKYTYDPLQPVDVIRYVTYDANYAEIYDENGTLIYGAAGATRLNNAALAALPYYLRKLPNESIGYDVFVSDYHSSINANNGIYYANFVVDNVPELDGNVMGFLSLSREKGGEYILSKNPVANYVNFHHSKHKIALNEELDTNEQLIMVLEDVADTIFVEYKIKLTFVYEV